MGTGQNARGSIGKHVLGLRAFCDSYEEVPALKAKVFSLADMSEGKANDDGYRGVHLYFQFLFLSLKSDRILFSSFLMKGCGLNYGKKADNEHAEGQGSFRGSGGVHHLADSEGRF